MQVLVTLRGHDDDGIPPHKVYGEAPTEDCPLAVVQDHHFDHETGAWVALSDFNITHRATGFQLGGKTWSTQAEALAVLERCQPNFPAWPLAGPDNETAQLACCAIFRSAAA